MHLLFLISGIVGWDELLMSRMSFKGVKHLLLILIIAMGGIGMELTAAGRTDSIEVRFKLSHTDVDRTFDHNGDRLDSVMARMRTENVSGAGRCVNYVEVVGGASPEGSIGLNRALSEQRAKAIFNIFRNAGFVGDTAVNFTFIGRDWAGLRRLVLSDSQVPQREAVLEVLDAVVASDGELTNPLEQLKAIGGGESYRYLSRVLFPALRVSHLKIDYTEHSAYPIYIASHPQPLAIEISDYPVSLESFSEPTQRAERKPLYMSVKTNLLYDAALLPDLGAEFYVGRNWSVYGDWMYGWWSRNATHRYWRAYGGTIGIRRWFGSKAADKPLTGHHIGVFGGIVTFDFEFGHRGYMGGRPHGTLWDRCWSGGGIEYGYSLPVAKRLNVDFTLGIGYMGGKLVEYEPKEGFYQWESTKRVHWFGPVKAEISLVWLIGHDNINRKGGSL